MIMFVCCVNACYVIVCCIALLRCMLMYCVVLCCDILCVSMYDFLLCVGVCIYVMIVSFVC